MNMRISVQSILLSVMLATSPVAVWADVTFTVDKDLPAPEDKVTTLPGREISRFLMVEYNLTQGTQGYQGTDTTVIAASFWDDDLCYFGDDAFFQGMIRAFAEHRPVTLSPDVIWLLISQGFSQYVNQHSEQMRQLLVSHEGKKELRVNSDKPYIDCDWPVIVENFTSQINDNTKGNIARILASPFSTTGTTELVAHRITLMENVRTYFEYVVEYVVCGIPYITLTGTSKDWNDVLNRTRSLDRYGMQWWTKDLVPILEEFVKASEGKPDDAFWRDIVKIDHPDVVRGRSCNPSYKPTEFDGWFLKFLPYMKDSKRTPEKVTMLTEMAPEIVRVPFRYEEYRMQNGKRIVTCNMQMELWAGIIGMSQDPTTLCLTPQIGWLVRISEQDFKNVFEGNSGEIGRRDKITTLRVDAVPEELSKMTHFDYLHLAFTGDIVIPEWMDKITIGRFIVEGKITDQEKENLIKRFPNIEIRNTLK